MRFVSATIQNYRQYRNVVIDFPESYHDLHILIGDNGTGKTNLMNAFTWCLYGIEPHLGLNDAGRGEPKINKGAITDVLAAGRNQTTVSIELEIAQDSDLIRATRSLNVRINSPTDVFEQRSSERFKVQVIRESGNDLSFTDDIAKDYIDRLIPLGIREYFFFDGEQLSDYFASNEGGRVKAAIHSISQIDIVTNMADKTKKATASLRRGVSKDKPDIQEMSNRIDSFEHKAEKETAHLREYKEQLRQAKARHEELAELLRGIPDIAELEKERDKLLKQQKSREGDVKNARDDLIRFARQAYVDFALYDDAKRALEMISQMESERQLPPSVDRYYLHQMLDADTCLVCGRPLNDDERYHINELLERYRVTSDTSHILVGMRSELNRLLERVQGYPQKRDKLVHSLERANKDLSETENRLSEVESLIAQYPNAEKIKQWFTELKEREEDIATLNQRIGSTGQIIANLESEAEKTRQDLDRMIKLMGQQEEISKAIEFGERAERILRRVEAQTIEEVRLRMSSQTETLFKGLVWKDSKCDHVELDENYDLTLYDRLGFSCEGTCSAAERSLLALSFTLSMHDVAGFNNPLFIDTPIARASGENRANFADTLSEVSKQKQLILTFTPDEYSEAIASVFDPIAATHMTLVFNEDEQEVKVRSDHD